MGLTSIDEIIAMKWRLFLELLIFILWVKAQIGFLVTFSRPVILPDVNY